MFRILEIGLDGAVTMYDDAARIGPPPEGVIRWVDLSAQDEPQLELLRLGFNFHPLAIEDCSHFDQRPKVEEYDNYLFIVTQGFVCEGGSVENLKILELHTFMGQHFLVTVHSEGIEALDSVWKRATSDANLLKRGVDFVLYMIADRMVDGNFPILDLAAEELEVLEEEVLSNPRRENLTRIFALKHQLVSMRKVLSPQRDVFGALTKLDHPYIAERTLHYFRDVYDHLIRITESIEANRDLLGNALEAYLSSVSQRTNEIMKYLTIMSAVFLPLAFVVGFFGQNFQNLIGMQDWMQSDSLMWGMVILCVTIPVVMIIWFKRKGWV
ncbi:MAG TPA: magnesium/cobalt transporter CorA [Oligoflexus sp.]|uniref:magnesium/cobalt transporter CorA n=1 Tax=Oligoflexus sp. TaxID=1971216 RepID=UPI002D8013AA|nr:magnesium/cobalt transporter CorA [Oligoflexus sp.]HET9237651.1 magnesium/cobalt transporter CorA [Oligoflexus sp.]